MKIKVFLNRLGHEHFLTEIEIPCKPNKKDLINIELHNQDTKEVEENVYKINQVLFDTSLNEYSVFVELYNWEE